MSTEKKESEKNDETVDEALQNIPKISKIIFDEKTGTVTLKLATEEEIAQAEKEKGPT
jgi:hypothetical protein